MCVYGIPGNVKEFGIQKQNDSDSVEQNHFISFGIEKRRIQIYPFNS